MELNIAVGIKKMFGTARWIRKDRNDVKGAMYIKLENGEI